HLIGPAEEPQRLTRRGVEIDRGFDVLQRVSSTPRLDQDAAQVETATHVRGIERNRLYEGALGAREVAGLEGRAADRVELGRRRGRRLRGLRRGRSRNRGRRGD